jgi:hypothetical protein
MRQKNKFYTDINLINLPIFSSSKKINRSNKTEEIVLNKNGVKTKLIIQYPEEKLTFFDRKILAGIEYLFCNLHNISSLEEAYNKEFIIQKKIFLKKFNIDEDDIKQSETQQIIFETMSVIQKEFKLYITMKDINNLIYNNTYAHSMIKKSLEKLQQTIIKQESDYFVNSSRLELPEVSLLSFSLSKTKNRDTMIVSLNPFHLVNLLKRNFYISDIKLLNSFQSSIAGRLHELIKKALYGSKLFNKDKVVYDYKFICNYLQVEVRNSKSLILQQFEKPLKELIEKKIIVNWEIQKNLFDFEILFYHSLQYYNNFWNTLDETIQRKINFGLAQLYKDEEEYNTFNKEIEAFMESLSFAEQEKYDNLKDFYTKYYYLQKYKIGEE